MKKVYLHPEMEVVEIKGQVLLAGSLPLSLTEEVNSGDILAPELEVDLGEALFPETHYWEF